MASLSFRAASGARTSRVSVFTIFIEDMASATNDPKSGRTTTKTTRMTRMTRTPIQAAAVSSAFGVWPWVFGIEAGLYRTVGTTGR
eukprot:3302962-Rhodomonas_salina.3